MTELAVQDDGRVDPLLSYLRRNLAWLFLLVVSVGYQVQQGTTVDVSWLITLSERVLDGQTAYVDFFELNPPASFLLYMPAVAAARLLHIAPEATVKASIYLLFVGNTLLLQRMWRQRRDGAKRASHLFTVAAAAIFLLVPGDVFAQREHFIALLLLPAAAVLTARAHGETVSPLLAFVAGVQAGLALDIKPHFALALALPWSLVVLRARSDFPTLRRCILAPEIVTALLLAAIYAAIVYFIFPAFMKSALPIALDVYSLYKNSHLEFLLSNNAVLFYIPILVIVATSRHALQPTGVPLLASFGCLLAAVLQQKYYPYHVYPAIAFALLSLAFAASAYALRLGRRVVALIQVAGLIASITAATSCFASRLNNRELLETMRLLVPHPRIMTVAMGHGLGHPLVRQLEGTLVGRLCSPWMYFLIKRALRDPSMTQARRDLLQGYIRLEKNVIAEDIVRFRPDYILVEDHFDSDAKVETWPYIDENWIKSTQGLSAAFQSYTRVQVVRNVEVWARRIRS